MASGLARILGSTALSLLIASSTGGPSLARPSPGDSAMTPEACAALGYAAPVEERYDSVVVTGGEQALRGGRSPSIARVRG